MADVGRRAPRVLCIAGSPRRHGNSDRLLDALEAGVQDAGGVPVRIVASEAGIAPCRGCNACSSAGACVVRDAMDDVYPLLDSADAVAVCSPVYFASVPAVLKALYDRCEPYWARLFVLGQPRRPRKRPGALVLVGGGGDPFGTTCAVTPTKSVFGVLEVEMTELFEFVGADSPSDITRHPEALQRATEIGRALVKKALVP
jgi:multimeric flavodoxin WrbA